jgi:hypothetical protein
VKTSRARAPKKPAVGTYVYCVVKAGRRPPVAGITKGVPGTGPVRLLEVAPARYLVVADAALDKLGEGQIGRLVADFQWVSRAVLAHEAVVESFIGVDALLPLKLFTIFTSDERALDHVRGDWRRIERHLKRVARHVEWGVRVMVDRPRSVRSTDADKKTMGSGTDYLVGKRRQRDAAVAHRRQVHAHAAGVYSALAAAASEATQRPLAATVADGGRVVLDAAFLVATSRSARFRVAAARQSRAVAQAGLALQLTGPWPPYSFIGDA